MKNDHQSKTVPDTIYLVAGGTGGHINSALAIGDYFAERGLGAVRYITGKRPLDFKLLGSEKTLHLPAKALLGSKNPFKLSWFIALNIWCLIKAWREFGAFRPILVFGTGGYVCGPTLLAAKLRGVPVAILEQNSVMGFTNRLISLFADHIFLNFSATNALPKRVLKERILVTGNPIRKQFVEMSSYHPEETENVDPSERPLRMLVFGGSLGASSINSFIWNIIQKPSGVPLQILHQTGNHPAPSISNFGHQIIYKSTPYLDSASMAKAYAWADLSLSRAGASTVSELQVVGKMSILIPYPGHKDRHQQLNAENLKALGKFPVFIYSDSRLGSEEFEREFQLILRSQYDSLRTKPQPSSTPSAQEVYRRPMEAIIGRLFPCFTTL